LSSSRLFLYEPQKSTPFPKQQEYPMAQFDRDFLRFVGESGSLAVLVDLRFR
jgi:hypothetical protein